MENRFKNYGLWVSIAALIPLILSSFGIQLIPNYQEIVNAILAILVTAGILSNPTTMSKWYHDDTSNVPTTSEDENNSNPKQ